MELYIILIRMSCEGNGFDTKVIHPKMKIQSLIRLLTLMSFQTCKTFVHFYNTNEHLFD